ncbi:MAG: hypothetical protein HC906_18540 [Bacteroidales bacterium]|nr:hypothetical protein [Bacteroidales bacterium]
MVLIPVTAQEARKSLLYPGFGIGFGFFYPGDVNDYITRELSGYTQEFGTYDMLMYLHAQAFLTYKIKSFDVTGLIEGAYAPKFISVDYSSTFKSYAFTRISPGVTGNYYLPIGSKRHALYFGGGVQYHFLYFENFSAGNIGFRAQAGLSLQFKRINLQPHAVFNYINADDESKRPSFNLNYTGGQIGINVSFHSPVAHR